MRRSIRIGILLPLGGAALLLIAPTALAAGLSVSSGTMGTATTSTPKLYPTGLTVANAATKTSGKAEKSDTVTAGFSEELQASSVCGGAPTTVGTQTIASATVTITNNAGTTGNDVLTVSSVPTSSCTGGVFRFGSVDLGSAGYTTSTATFTTSAVALTQT